MKHGTLSQGKKSTVDPSSTGLEFHKPFTHGKPDKDNK